MRIAPPVVLLGQLEAPHVRVSDLGELGDDLVDHGIVVIARHEVQPDASGGEVLLRQGEPLAHPLAHPLLEVPRPPTVSASAAEGTPPKSIFLKPASEPWKSEPYRSLVILPLGAFPSIRF